MMWTPSATGITYGPVSVLGPVLPAGPGPLARSVPDLLASQAAAATTTSAAHATAHTRRSITESLRRFAPNRPY